ncbi:MAG: hypothetical protein H6538_08200 [Bacteroidales bacterium]|nr:hypothetical protein [Bacteroidales bacterium]MCB8998916.1 hypothetical protein [Bacteroidales bacterium]
MSLTNAKHIITEIDGVRCSVVETGATADRVKFLKELLEHNKFEVKVLEVQAEEGGEPSYTVGVTDLVFNPVFSVYDRSLRTRDGQIVSPDIWNQKATVYKSNYWVK